MKEILSQNISATTNKPLSKTKLVKKDFQSNDKLNQEIKNLEKLISLGETQILNENNKIENIKDFQARLNKSIKLNDYSLGRQKELKNLQDTNLFESLDMQGADLKFDREADDEDVKRQLAAVLDLIREAKSNIAKLDKFWMNLLNNKGFTSFSDKNSKFIKLADDMKKEADEVIEEYYDDLYEDSEGSPNYGKILNNPEKYHHTLTTDASTSPKVSKFKKI